MNQTAYKCGYWLSGVDGNHLTTPQSVNLLLTHETSRLKRLFTWLLIRWSQSSTSQWSVHFTAVSGVSP